MAAATLREFDVVVLGGGAAGIAAARAAVRGGAARVALVSAGAGATEMTFGWILPPVPRGRGTETDGETAAALAFLPEVGLRPAGRYRFATVAGTLTAAVAGVASLLDLGAPVDDGAPLGVVDLVAGPAWSAELCAASLGEALGRATRVVVPGTGVPRGESPAELARALDTAGVADALAAALRAAAKGCGALLFPPALGLLRDGVAAQFAAALGVPCGETGGGPSDPPALRLARALARAVPGEVARLAGRATVRGADGGADALARVAIGADELRARAVVLATGGLTGAGLVFDGGFAEPAARAPVWLPGGAGDVLGSDAGLLPLPGAARGADPYPLFAPDAAGRTVAAAAGVRLTDDGRVAGFDGRTALYPWLFAAGGVVASAARAEGYGPPLGEVLRAGYVAGRRAARFAAQSR